MTDFLEKSMLLDGLCGTFPSEKAKVKDNETSAASAILKSALNITTTCDSYYQTTNKRKDNPEVLINMDKLKLCFIWLRTLHVFPLSNLKSIPDYS